MKVLSTIALVVVLCAASVAAQDTRCTLKLAELPDSPELFGFRMGMTDVQVKSRVPQVAFAKANDFGVGKTSISPDFDPSIDKASFNGVRTISIDLLDGQVTSLWYGYDSSFKWHTVPEFVEGISRALRLPDAWTEWKSRGQQLTCSDFQLTVTTMAEGPSFHIIDQAAEKTIARRRAEKEQEAEVSAEKEDEDDAPTEIIADRGDMIYYVGGCLPTREIKQSDRLVFKTKEAAEKAGYKLAKRCKQ
ncbi:MAG TPA: hypothetical protein VLL54_02870 [Pyrinomonadaceae bacterium]|nr:hypothetical protein [Pyrinomonadaceae bacterium]